jgi:hypothetical protein
MTTTAMQPAHDTRRSGGAPPANRNSFRHGLRSSRLPKGCERIGRDLSEVRRSLEDAVVLVRGVVTAGEALAISAACEWERHRRLALRWLRVDFDAMDLPTRLTFSREAARAASERNRAIDGLKLDPAPSDVWARLNLPTDGRASDG